MKCGDAVPGRVYFESTSSCLSGCRTQNSLPFFFFGFELMLNLQQLSLCLISPPVSLQTIFCCAPLRVSHCCLLRSVSTALRDHSNLFCSKLQQCREGWKGRNYWKIWLLHLFWRLNFTCSTKPSKTVKNPDCSSLKHSSLPKNFPDYWECFPDDAKSMYHPVITGGYPRHSLPSSKMSLLHFILCSSDPGGDSVPWGALHDQSSGCDGNLEPQSSSLYCRALRGAICAHWELQSPWLAADTSIYVDLCLCFIPAKFRRN